MPKLADQRQQEPLGSEWVGAHYVLGTSPETWPEMVRGLKPAQETAARVPEVSLSEAVSVVGETIYRQVVSVMREIQQWGQKNILAQKPKTSAEAFPDIEYTLCPNVTPKKTIRLEGSIRSIQRGREEFTLSEADLEMLLEAMDG